MQKFIDRWSQWLENILEKRGTLIRSMCSGFLLGRFTNEINDQNKTILAAVKGTFDSSARNNNVLSWVALATAILLPLITQRISQFNRTRQRTTVFSKILSKYRSPKLAAHIGFAWGDAISLQIAPNIYQGWRHDETIFDHRSQHFEFSDGSAEEFKAFYEKNFDRLRFKDDGVKVWLTKNPTAFTDSPSLKLETQLTRYSQCKFKEEVLTPNESWKEERVASAINGVISFPHSLCMHAIICTADDRVLITKRSRKASYYPGAWSCSLEEQITPEDLRGKESVVLLWARRMLDEELGLEPSELNPDNLRVMSVFLESDIMNVSLCTHISLNLDSKELDLRLRLLPRKDNEFSEWQFMTHRELIDELRSPTSTHHASTGYRIVFALIKRFGDIATLERILRQEGFAN